MSANHPLGSNEAFDRGQVDPVELAEIAPFVAVEAASVSASVGYVVALASPVTVDEALEPEPQGPEGLEGLGALEGLELVELLDARSQRHVLQLLQLQPNWLKPLEANDSAGSALLVPLVPLVVAVVAVAVAGAVGVAVEVRKFEALERLEWCPRTISLDAYHQEVHGQKLAAVDGKDVSSETWEIANLCKLGFESGSHEASWVAGSFPDHGSREWPWPAASGCWVGRCILRLTQVMQPPAQRIPKRMEYSTVPIWVPNDPNIYRNDPTRTTTVATRQSKRSHMPCPSRPTCGEHA